MMTPAQAAAFVGAQTALFNAEIEMMKAANYIGIRDNNHVPFGEEQFAALIKSYEGVLGHNAMIEFFRWHQAGT